MHKREHGKCVCANKKREGQNEESQRDEIPNGRNGIVGDFNWHH